MKPRKLRVLLDLSMASRGYCGIAQDVRLLYKTLAQSSDIDVTGLVYRPHKLARTHRFARPEDSRADQLANQATFLWTLAEGDSFGASHRWRRLQQLPALCSTLLARPARQASLDTQKLGDTLWRLMFHQSLPPEDRELVARGKFMLSDLSDGKLFARALSGRRPIAVDTKGYDFLIVQGARPMRVSAGTRQIARYHDMIPVLEPDTMKHPWAIRWHQQAIRQSRQSVFVCNSEPTRDDLVSVFPEIRERATTIPYTRSDQFERRESPSLAASILAQRQSPATKHRRQRSLPRYLMCVSTLEPRKNFLGLIQAYSRAASLGSVRRQVGKLKLVIVGGPGWKHGPIMDAIRPLAARGDLIHLEGVPADELRVLYSHAEAVVFPSHAEGFGFPPLESLQCETPVIASELPSHRWVLGDAALYCDPYSVDSIVSCIERLIAAEDSPTLRRRLLANGRRQIERFSRERCAGKWTRLLERLASGGTVHETSETEAKSSQMPIAA